MNTLNDFQKLLGDIKWIRPFLRLTTAQLKPLFNILQGDADPSSPRALTPEAKGALAWVEQALRQSQVLRLDYGKGWQLILLPTVVAPTGVLWQNRPLEWIHLPATAKKVVAPYPGLLASLIVNGHKRSIELFGQEPQEIIVPYSKEQLDSLIGCDTDWQIALGR